MLNAGGWVGGMVCTPQLKQSGLGWGWCWLEHAGTFAHELPCIFCFAIIIFCHVHPSSGAGLAVVGLSHAASLGALWQAGVLAHTKLAAAKIALQGSLAAFVLFNYACAKK